MTQARKRRGMRTQALVAQHLAANGWPYAESTGAGRSGSDVTGVPGLAIEVKARADLNPSGWLKQASTCPGLPIVIHRPNGLGERPGDFIAYLRLDDLIPLLRAAGYGTELEEDRA